MILVSALEPSANLHLSYILKEEQFEINGIFDKRFGRAIVDSNEFNVMGFFDVLPKIKLARDTIKKMAELSKKADKVLLIDAPSFNLPLAKEIKKVNPKIEIIYYILPKVWAWKKGRIKKINQFIDKKAYIFPFEREYYKDGIYVGNPLLDEIKEFRELKYYNKIAFLPGSRKSEIKNLMPLFNQLKRKFKKPFLVIPLIYKDKISQIYGDISGYEIVFDTHYALRNSDFAYICSGTATLEAAIIGTPFVLVYKTREIEYLIAKTLVKLNYIGLANIIFERENLGEFHKEYIQHFDIDMLYEDYKNASLDKFLEKSKKLRNILKKGSAKEVVKLLKS